MSLLSFVWSDLPSLPFPMALAVVALVGYLFGRRSKGPNATPADEARRELKRARAVAQELEKIATEIRRDLATHSTSIGRFKDRVAELNDDHKSPDWQKLSREAEEMLQPTMQLASQISHSYDQIRHQMNHLMTFTEVRTDPLTGLTNRRAMDESLENLFAMFGRYQTPFSVIIVDIDHFKRINDELGHLSGDRMLQQVARMLDDSARESDVVARYGGEEFVLLLPKAPLDRACVFADRIRASIEAETKMTISIGIAAALDGDSPESILARADKALYGAKAAGRNCCWQHTGDDVQAIVFEDEPLAASC
ncbi:MAG: diguanylate cyclase [Pirellulales bacterium]|nr:diguanylate cyclase [Pirellulales bacterium]